MTILIEQLQLEDETQQHSLKAEMRQQVIRLRNDQNFCADCFSPDPEWTSTSLGIFICVACCGIHRHLGTHISRVKSIKLDDWTPAMVEDMRRHSNQSSNAHYLHHLPRAFKRIEQADPVYLREEMILDKYLRKNYARRESLPLCEDVHDWAPFKVGYLLKRGKYSNKQWNRRFFKLINNRIVYYKSQNDIDREMGSMQIDKVWISDVKTGRTHTLQVVGNDGRSLFLQFEKAKELLDWFNFLRLAKSFVVQQRLQSQLSKQHNAYHHDLIDRDLKLLMGEDDSVKSIPSAYEQQQIYADYEAVIQCSLLVEGYLEYQSVGRNVADGSASISTRSWFSSASSLNSTSSLNDTNTASRSNTSTLKRRWTKVFATLTHDKFYVYKHPQDAFPIETILMREVELYGDDSTNTTPSPFVSSNKDRPNQQQSLLDLASSAATGDHQHGSGNNNEGSSRTSSMRTGSSLLSLASNSSCSFQLCRRADNESRWIFKCESELAKQRWTNAIHNLFIMNARHDYY